MRTSATRPGIATPTWARSTANFGPGGPAPWANTVTQQNSGQSVESDHPQEDRDAIRTVRVASHGRGADDGSRPAEALGQFRRTGPRGHREDDGSHRTPSGQATGPG